MLISLKPGKSKSFCENRACKVRLIGPYKILRRGEQGYAFHICITCFNGIMRKGGPNKYLPGQINKNKDLTPSTYSGIHNNDYLVDITPKNGTVKISQNTRTGQIIL